jgi:hypothetical protein
MRGRFAGRCARAKSGHVNRRDTEKPYEFAPVHCAVPPVLAARRIAHAWQDIAALQDRNSVEVGSGSNWDYRRPSAYVCFRRLSRHRFISVSWADSGQCAVVYTLNFGTEIFAGPGVPTKALRDHQSNLTLAVQQLT